MPRQANQPSGSLEDRFQSWIEAKEATAHALPAGAERDALLSHVHQLKITAHLESWVAITGR